MKAYVYDIESRILVIEVEAEDEKAIEEWFAFSDIDRELYGLTYSPRIWNGRQIKKG